MPSARPSTSQQLAGVGLFGLRIDVRGIDTIPGDIMQGGAPPVMWTLVYNPTN